MSPTQREQLKDRDVAMVCFIFVLLVLRDY